VYFTAIPSEDWPRAVDAWPSSSQCRASIDANDKGSDSLGARGDDPRTEYVLIPLMPPKRDCHPQHDTKGAGTKICKCSSKINMKSTSAQIIPI
jgi:hypothetical protein